MPRLAVTDTEKKRAAIRGTITQFMDQRRVDDDYMAEKLGITKETFVRKMHDTGKFTVEQLIMISNILQIPISVNFFIGASPQNEDLAYRIAGLILQGRTS